MNERFHDHVLIKNIHKIYIVLALVIGLGMSIAMPIFSEPDGQYHYTAATNIAGLTNDLSAYGEDEIGSGIGKEIIQYQTSNYFEEYFLNKIVEMPLEDLPRLNYPIAKNTYNYWGHLVPAAGVAIGHKIYPSLGVMVVAARMLSVFVYAIAMFLIIRYVKGGKLLFFAVSLSPVIMNTFASLSYDGLSYVLSALLIAIAINISVQRRAYVWDLILAVIASGAVWVAAKTNFKLLLVMVPAAILFNFFRNLRDKHEQTVGQAHTSRASRVREMSKKHWGWLIPVVALVAFGLVLWLKPTLYYAFYRFILTFGVNFDGSMGITNLFQTMLAAPYPSINHLPLWVSMVWVLIVVILSAADEKFVKTKLISWFAVLLFLAGLAGVYYEYVGYFAPKVEMTQDRYLGVIQGVQGRYFTPTILLLSLIAGYDKFPLKIKFSNVLLYVTILMIVVTNFMLVFNTLYAVYFIV
jgi:uncharacterized membrane protein